jgi:hypothetical protein
MAPALLYAMAMRDPSFLIGGGVAAWVLLMIAFPKLFMPQPGSGKTKVGPTFWGVYDGAPTEENEANQRIELNPLVGTKRGVVAGSTMYAQGRAPSSRM